MPSLLPYGKAGGHQILRWQGFAVKGYGFTLAALTLEPSDFCNDGDNMMNFCSQCGGPVKHLIPADDDRLRHVCSSCGTIHYQNPKLVVGCIPVWEDRILMCRRDIEPRRGFWTLPAGFLENGETATDGARRETLEETGSRATDLAPYLMVDIVRINQIYLMFRSRLQAPDFHPTRESSEVKLVEAGDIPWNDIAFKVVEKTLKHYLKDRVSGDFTFRTDKIE